VGGAPESVVPEVTALGLMQIMQQLDRDLAGAGFDGGVPGA